MNKYKKMRMLTILLAIILLALNKLVLTTSTGVWIALPAVSTTFLWVTLQWVKGIKTIDELNKKLEEHEN